jgi:hypothetical protein
MEGADFVESHAGNDTICTGSGVDTVKAGGGDECYIGTEGIVTDCELGDVSDDDPVPQDGKGKRN